MPNIHFRPLTLSDKFAYSLVKFLRIFVDFFFKERYGNRAIVLETVAAVPGMVGGALIHLRCLRKMEADHGWIKQLLDEAENERMHLMTFVEVIKPNLLERCLVIFAQFTFIIFYGIFYIISMKGAHRFVGYLEEEAVISYTRYLEEIDSGRIPNTPAPKFACDYWNLSSTATLRDVIIIIRDEEGAHRDVNHSFANQLNT